MEKDAQDSSDGPCNQQRLRSPNTSPWLAMPGGLSLSLWDLQILNCKMRDWNGIGSRRSTGADENHSNFPRVYCTKSNTQMMEKKIASQVTFSLEKLSLHSRKLMRCLAMNIQTHWAGHPGDLHFCINASTGAKGCMRPGTRKKRKIKLKAQTPASKSVGSSNHSDRPVAVIGLSYPINQLFNHWEVDASCQLTVIPTPPLHIYVLFASHLYHPDQERLINT